MIAHLRNLYLNNVDIGLLMRRKTMHDIKVSTFTDPVRYMTKEEIKKEYELIVDKKSALSKSQRDKVAYRYFSENLHKEGKSNG